MGSGFFTYLQELEMMAFFSGYPLVYLLVRVAAGNRMIKNKSNVKYLSLLPFAYALVGTLYLGLLLRNLHPDYSFQHIQLKIPQRFLAIWGLMSILFWIPPIARRTILSILHSLVFFALLLRDLFFQLTGMVSDKTIVQNDMKIYSVSLLLNLVAIILVSLISLLFGFRRKH